MSQIEVVGASWCGHTVNFWKNLDANYGPDSASDPSIHSAFKKIDCDVDPTNPACEDVKGFPTMKYNGEVCLVGAGDPEKVLCKCMPTHPACKSSSCSAP